MKLLTLRKLHKWVGLVVGVQLLLWCVSGLMFAWLDHGDINGEHLAAPLPLVALPADQPLAEPSTWLEQYADRAVHEVRLHPLDGAWFYRVAHDRGIELRRAADGTPYRLDAAAARRLASSYYRGGGTLTAVTYHAGETLESRTLGPTWQARFDDAARTSLYLSAGDGTLAAARGDTWRLFDFFWMLHTTDYAGRDDFNNPLVILAGTAALWIALTGMLLLFRVFRRSDFGF